MVPVNVLGVLEHIPICLAPILLRVAIWIAPGLVLGHVFAAHAVGELTSSNRRPEDTRVPAVVIAEGNPRQKSSAARSASGGGHLGAAHAIASRRAPIFALEKKKAAPKGGLKVARRRRDSNSRVRARFERRPFPTD